MDVRINYNLISLVIEHKNKICDNKHKMPSFRIWIDQVNTGHVNTTHAPGFKKYYKRVLNRNER